MDILSEENLYKGFLKLDKLTIKLPNGEIIVRELIRKKDTVSIIALTDDNEIYFVKQPRAGSGKLDSIELPAGLIEPGENPEESAKRELAEETGCIAENFKMIQEFVSDPACCDNKSYIYLAEHAQKVKELNLDDDEYLEPIKLPINKVFEMLDSGEINDSASIISLLKLKTLKFLK